MTLYVDLPMKLTPAEVVFQVFGGPRETARILKLTHQSVARWTEGVGRANKPKRRAGKVPTHHLQTLLEEAVRRGKHLTLEDLVFGREPATQGIVKVKDGVKVEIKMHDTYQSMVNTLVGA